MIGPRVILTRLEDSCLRTIVVYAKTTTDLGHLVQLITCEIVLN